MKRDKFFGSRGLMLAGIVAVMAMVIVVSFATLAADTPNPSSALTFERLTEYNWNLLKEVSVDQLELGRGETIAVDYEITATRVVEVNERMALRGNALWADTIIVSYRNKGRWVEINTFSVTPNVDFELFFAPVSGVRDYRARYENLGGGTSRSFNQDFRIGDTPVSLVSGFESVELFDAIDFPTGSGLTIVANPDHNWPKTITGCELDGNGQYQVVYSLTIANVSADHGATIEIDNLAALFPLEFSKVCSQAVEYSELIVVPAPIATASAEVTVTTPAETPNGKPVIPDLPSTGGSNLVFAGIGLLFAALGVALRR